MRDRGAGAVTVTDNIANAPMSSFVDGPGGGLHLAPGASAIDAGTAAYADFALWDIDGEPRDGSPDIGADEWSP